MLVKQIDKFYHEDIVSRMERMIKRLWVLVVMLIVLIVVSNAYHLWVYFGR